MGQTRRLKNKEEVNMTHVPGNALSMATDPYRIIASIVLLLYVGFCMYSLANRFGRTDGWLGFIPLISLWYLVVLSDLPRWLALTMFIPPVYLIVAIVASWKISEKTGKPGWIAILLLIPLVNLFVPGYIAWA